MKIRKKIEWSRLDNAAKIFPPNSNDKDTKVFRIACELYEDVIEENLQHALEKTIEKFPMYHCVLRKGLFWYYFEYSNLPIKVTKEELPVCSKLYFSDTKTLLFRVSYYGKRINLEVYHSLTDGTGAQWFMKYLLYQYFLDCSEELEGKDIPHILIEGSTNKSMDDSFAKHFTGKEKIKGTIRRKAYRISGSRNEEKRIQLVEAIIPVDQVLTLAKSYKTTLTVFITSLFIYSIYKDMPERSKKVPIILSIPVNLRNHFPSVSSRNFFSTIFVSYDTTDKNITLDKIIQKIDDDFKRELMEDKLKAQMEKLLAIETNFFARVIPRVLKDIALKIANYTVDRGVTAALSNLGKIQMPDGMKDKIRLFDVFTSARRPQICMCSYENNLVISFTSPYKENEIQREFITTLTNMGIHVEVGTNIE